jgi:hypothetical protein
MNLEAQELEELIRLAEKHNTPQAARKIIEYAKMRLKEGDYGFLKNKLEQLRMVDEIYKRTT